MAATTQPHSTAAGGGSQAGTAATTQHADTRIVEFLVIPRNIAGAAGIFLGFYFLFAESAADAVRWVCLLSVGCVGLIAYLSHVVFARADAQRLGFGDKPSGFQYEVGFFNLAVAVVAVLAFVLSWGVTAQAALCVVYAAYFLQCAGLFMLRVRRKENGGRFIKNVVIFLLLGGLILFFGVAALVA